jgi:hypothetical protein
MGSDPENRVSDQDNGSPGRPVSSGLQVPGELFPSWSGYRLISTPVYIISGNVRFKLVVFLGLVFYLISL